MELRKIDGNRTGEIFRNEKSFCTTDGMARVGALGLPLVFPHTSGLEESLVS